MSRAFDKIKEGLGEAIDLVRGHQIPSGINPKEKGRAPEGCGQGNDPMLNVADKNDVSKQFLPLSRRQYVSQSPQKNAADWLEAEIAKAHGTVTTQIIELTPPLAAAMLNRNPENRRVSTSSVDIYARDIRNDKWLLNGEPLIISDTGELNDGQHRCEAVITADKSIPVLLVIGIKRDTRTSLDQGKGRSIGDYLAMTGFTNTVLLGSVASACWQYCTLGKLASGASMRPTKGELQQFIKENEETLSASVSAVSRKGVDAAGGKVTVGAVHWILTKHAGQVAASMFTNALIDGANLGVGHPILYARNRLVNERGRIRAWSKTELLFKAWNAYRRKDTIRHVILTGGKLPKLEA